MNRNSETFHCHSRQNDFYSEHTVNTWRPGRPRYCLECGAVLQWDTYLGMWGTVPFFIEGL